MNEDGIAWLGFGCMIPSSCLHGGSIRRIGGRCLASSRCVLEEVFVCLYVQERNSEPDGCAKPVYASRLVPKQPTKQVSKRRNALSVPYLTTEAEEYIHLQKRTAHNSISFSTLMPLSLPRLACFLPTSTPHRAPARSTVDSLVLFLHRLQHLLQPHQHIHQRGARRHRHAGVWQRQRRERG